jgi:hypothetical protein
MFPFPFSFIAPTASGLADIDNVYSMEFDGVNDYINAGTGSELKPNIVSCSVWIKGAANTAYSRILSQDGPTGGADGYGFYVTTATNEVVFAIKTDVTGTVTSSSSGVVLDGTWHHLVGTYDGSNVNIYVDGNIVGSPVAGTAVLSYGIGGLTIGCMSEPTALPSYLFTGNIDEVAIFNYALDSDQVEEIYNATSTGKTADLSAMATPPVAWYRMGD